MGTRCPIPPTMSSMPTIKLDHQYFSLRQAGVAWEAIARARNVAAYAPAEFQNLQAELIILLPEGQSAGW